LGTIQGKSNRANQTTFIAAIKTHHWVVSLLLELQSLMLQHLIIDLLLIIVDPHHIIVHIRLLLILHISLLLILLVIRCGLGRIWRPGLSPESEMKIN